MERYVTEEISKPTAGKQEQQETPQLDGTASLTNGPSG
jgi:hypothetical protein